MKTTPRRGRAAFTLIELMAVITIIVILAGLVVGGMGYVNEKQARERAKVQIALISRALEEYKLDMGVYPPTANRSGTFSATTGTATSSVLFDHLYWDSDRNGKGGTADTDQKIYLPQLDPANSKQGWTTTPPALGANTIITDPWGNQYCYRSALNAAGTANNDTQNPDFDLWSMGKDGKSVPATASDPSNKDDIRNF